MSPDPCPVRLTRLTAWSSSSAIRLANTGYKVDPSLSAVATFINDGRTVPFMDQLWPNPKVQQDMLSGLQDIFSGQSTPNQVLASMDTDYKAGSS